jgi:hypothetical protein
MQWCRVLARPSGVLAGTVVALLCLFGSFDATASSEAVPRTPVVVLKQASPTSLVFTWEPVANAAAYDVYLGTVHIGLTTFTRVEFKNLVCGKQYVIRIVAIDRAARSSTPSLTYARTNGCATSAPSAPTRSEPQPSSPSTSTKPTPPPAPIPTPTQPPTVPPPANNPATPSSGLSVAVGGSDRNPCSAAQPCATFDRAYHAAAPGQAVFVGAGSYPAQTINVDAAKRSAAADVVFMPASGAQPRIARVVISGSHVELRNLQTPWDVKSTANAVTLRNVSADGPVYISGASNVSVIGGQVYSPRPVSTDSMIASIGGKTPTNILIDGVAFHDFQDVGPGNAHHIECLQIGAGINLTIRNSSFTNCATHDIFMRSWGMLNNSPSPLSNVVIQNNTFAKTTNGFYAMQVMDDLWTGLPRTSVAILNNTAQQAILVRVTHGTAQVRGNFLPSMSAFFCNSYGQIAWFDYNTYGAGVPCGPHDRVLNQSSSTSSSPSTSTSSGTRGFN